MRTLQIPVGISNRHLHLSEADIKLLFGENHGLTKKKILVSLGNLPAKKQLLSADLRGVWKM